MNGVGIPCIVVALLVQFWTDNLVWAVTASVPLGIIIQFVRSRIRKESSEGTEIAVPEYKSWREAVRSEFMLVKPVINLPVVIGALALSTLTLGGNIAYHAVNLDIAGASGGYNEVSVISGVADFFSSLFGGTAMEVIVTATSVAPNPVVSGVLLMLGAAIVIATGWVYKIAKYVPVAAMGGYLIVIGAVLVLPFNAIDAFAAGNPFVVAVTMGTTVSTNPFYGLLAGLLSKLVLGLLGVL